MRCSPLNRALDKRGHMKQYRCITYGADSKRGDGNQKVLAFRIESPDDVLEKENNPILSALKAENLSGSIGLYFYIHADSTKPFIKIGECTRSDGISVRFSRGWHGTVAYSDSYRGRKKNGKVESSKFLSEIKKITVENPGYFIFYEHKTSGSHPKIDEVYAYRVHKRLFKCGTLNPERMNGNPLLARKLIWHKSAFSEVYKRQFPDGSSFV